MNRIIIIVTLDVLYGEHQQFASQNCLIGLEGLREEALFYAREAAYNRSRDQNCRPAGYKQRLSRKCNITALARQELRTFAVSRMKTDNKKKSSILVTGACGQIGTELVLALREKYGWRNVIASDIYPPMDELQRGGAYVRIDVLNKKRLAYIMRHLGVKQVYHLAALLSAKGEENPAVTWDLNMQGLLNVLEAALENRVEKVFWPSSIAVFGPQSARAACPQSSVTDPVTVYGISKVAGEFWCKYYFERYGLDVRSLRYPGLISYSAQAGGGTTNYAVDIFHQGLESGKYTCFLQPDTRLPMLYMPDAVRATMQLMEAPAAALTVRSSYNLDGMSFTPHELAASIRDQLPGFEITYAPDCRQKIADSWPSSIDARHARADWGWQPEYDMETMTVDMLVQLTKPSDERIRQVASGNKLKEPAPFASKKARTA